MSDAIKLTGDDEQDCDEKEELGIYKTASMWFDGNEVSLESSSYINRVVSQKTISSILKIFCPATTVTVKISR